MIYIFNKSTLCIITLLLCAVSSNSYGDAPDLQTPAPVIYLQSNLDEQANLGWCIDTIGRGFGEQIHSHSCKPAGGDVQFDFNAQTGNIESVEYPKKCLTVIDTTDPSIPFGLLDCKDDEQSQEFAYDADNLLIYPSNDASLCIAVAPASRSAGPFMSRDLLLSICADTDPELMQWLVKNHENNSKGACSGCHVYQLKRHSRRIQ